MNSQSRCATPPAGSVLDARDRLLRSISEADWQTTVVQTAEAFGWWWWHDNDPRRNAAGWPDLTLIRPPRLVVVELKKETGKLSVAQRGLLGLMARCPGVEVYVWRPSDQRDMERILR